MSDGIHHLADSYMVLTWSELLEVAHSFVAVEGPIGRVTRGCNMGGVILVWLLRFGGWGFRFRV